MTERIDSATTLRLETIAASASAAVRARSVGELVRSLRSALLTAVAHDQFEVALLDAAGSRLSVVCADGHTSVPVEGSRFEAALREGAEPGQGLSDDHGWQAIVSLRTQDRAIGAIAVSRRGGRFDAADVALLEAVAACATAPLVAFRARDEVRATEGALRRREAMAALLQTVTSASNQALTFREAADICLSAVCDFRTWSSGRAWVRGGERNTGARTRDANDADRWRPVLSSGAISLFLPRSALVGQAAATGRPVWADADHDAVSDADAGAFPVYAFPIKFGREILAVLEFFAESRTPREPAFDDLTAQLGTQLAYVLERERAEDRIRFQARMLEAVGQAVVASDARHRVVYWNRAAEDLYGWTRAEAIGRIDSEVLQARADTEQTAEITARLASGQTWEGDYEIRTKNGVVVPVRITGAAITDAAGQTVGYVGVATDLRRSRDLEARLRKAQMMEAVGRLAGGVAHDFNNLLTSIKGITHLLLDDMPEDHAMRADIEEIRRAADRAATLTNQLLAFGRKQVLRPRVLDLNATLESRVRSLSRLLGDAIELTTDFEAGLGYVDVDASQIAQVVLNLVLNARDAMPQGGRITLRTRNAEVDRAAARRIGVEMRPGPFVVLEVQDTGTGIPPENLDLIFEPFFTTKHPAAGVGLGLSTVYGIVKQSHGHVAVESEQGAGTTFRVFLPRTHSTPEADVPSAPASAAQVSETLLLVEDEESVRRLARKILERKGYRVIEAGNGEEALERIAALDEPLDLIVTDVVMPRMSGAELARTLRDRGLRVPVLFMSGYADDSRVINDIAAARGTFLEKPFTPDALLRRVRTTLDANPRSGVR